jgi:hypothetical protein
MSDTFDLACWQGVPAMNTTAHCKYVLLSFASALEAQPTIPCLAVAQCLVRDRILVVVSSDWLESLPLAQRVYAEDFLTSWSRKRGRGVGDFYLLLPALSIGALRFLSSGSCSIRELSRLLPSENDEGRVICISEMCDDLRTVEELDGCGFRSCPYRSRA